MGTGSDFLPAKRKKEEIGACTHYVAARALAQQDWHDNKYGVEWGNRPGSPASWMMYGNGWTRSSGEARTRHNGDWLRFPPREAVKGGNRCLYPLCAINAYRTTG